MREPDVNALFIRTYEELIEKSQSNDSYDLLAIAAILRKLLIDGNPLAHIVNRTYRIKIQYYVGVPDSDELRPRRNTYWTMQDGFDPETSYPGRFSKIVSHDGLLRAKIIRAGNQTFTVKDLIKYEAYIMGAIHMDEPTSDEERALNAVSHFFKFDDNRATLRQFQAIARVILLGLSPLYNAVKESQIE